MNRREIIKSTGLGVLVLTTSGKVTAADHESTGFLLVHGSWHGGWCWSKVAESLHGNGYSSLAIDLPGCGINAVSPASYFKRPLDPAAFATEPSQFADIDSDAFADAVLHGADVLRATTGVKKVILVGHSMGGMPITLAAAKKPSAIDGLVFLAAPSSIPGKPAGAFLQIPEQVENSMLGEMLVADPEKIGGLRIDTASTDKNYVANVKAALAADVDDSLWRTAVNMMNPDAPAAIFGEMIDFPKEYSSIKKTYIRCSNDKTLVPEAQDAFISGINAAWPENPCTVVTMESSHEAMFSDPVGLADALLSAV